MSSPAQIAANQENAQSSTGPKTEEGKLASSRNNLRTGLTGSFVLLESESAADFAQLQDSLTAEHQPSTATELLLVQHLAEHSWLTDRALRLQTSCFNAEGIPDDKRLALYLRYQSTHQRAFHKCLNDLLRIRAERRRSEIGFESQKAKTAAETRKDELHQARLRNLTARSENLELDTDIRGSVEAPLPGHAKFSFSFLKQVISQALVETARECEAHPELTDIFYEKSPKKAA